MTWWGILAIVGGAAAGLAVAYVIAIVLTSRERPADQQIGGGPRWRTDAGEEPSRYATDNRLSWNPAAVMTVLVALAVLTGLALGLALG